LARAGSVAMARRKISTLARLVTRAAQRESGTVAPATLRVSGPGLRTMWWDVLGVTTEERPEDVDSSLRSAYAIVDLILTTRAYARPEPVTLVSEAIVDQADPVLVPPPVDTDAPAELEIDIDDLTEGGTGVNRWTIAAMPLAGTAPALTIPLTYPDPDPQA